MNDKFEKLNNFITSLGTTRLLLQRSNEGQFLIEALVLYSTLVDGLCRIALILKKQIIDKTDDFDDRYIFQDESERNYFTERDIYKQCQSLEYKILDEDLFVEINALYDVRNKAIHRFAISEIEYVHLGLTLEKYELVYQRLWTIVYGLEAEQIHKGMGMTKSGEVSKKIKNEVLEDVSKKIDSKDVGKLMKTLGNKLIKNFERFSEGEERNFISDEISDEKEIQEEKVMISPGYTSVKEITKWASRSRLMDKCKCTHEKMHHVNIKKCGGKKLKDCFGVCNIKDCDCKQYNYLPQE